MGRVNGRARWAGYAVAGVVVCTGSLLAYAAVAPDHSWSTLPYQGFLEQDGLPVNRAVDLCFEVFTVAQGGAPIWSEEALGVVVSAGAFAVDLGATNSLDPLLAETDVHLQTSVRDGSAGTPGPCTGGAGGYVALAGRQRLGAGVYALAARRGVPGQDFIVDGAGRLGVGTAAPGQALDVVGSAVVSGSLGVGIASPGRRLHVVGDGAVTGSLAVGQASTGAGLLLDVAGAAALRGGLVPDYDSGWFAISNAPSVQTLSRTHGLGAFPTRYEIQFSPTNPDSDPAAFVYPQGHGQSPNYNSTPGMTWEQPHSIRFSRTTMEYTVLTGQAVGRWYDSTGWHTWASGFWRIMLWK